MAWHYGRRPGHAACGVPYWLGVQSEGTGGRWQEKASSNQAWTGYLHIAAQVDWVLRLGIALACMPLRQLHSMPVHSDRRYAM